MARHTYASGDPLNFVDPTGRKTDTDAPPYVCNDACRHAGTRGHDFTIRYWVNPTPIGRILISIDSGELNPNDPVSKIFKAGFVPNASERSSLNAHGLSNEEIDDRIGSADVHTDGRVASGFGDMWNWAQQNPGWAIGAGALLVVGAFAGYDYVLAPMLVGGAADGAAIAATVGASAGTTVIGHYPAYLELAEELGGSAFSVSPEAWEAMTPAARWAANQAFLDAAIVNGDTFRLATSLDEMRAGSYFAREVEYLMSQGYVLNAEGTALIPGGH